MKKFLIVTGGFRFLQTDNEVAAKDAALRNKVFNTETGAALSPDMYPEVEEYEVVYGRHLNEDGTWKSAIATNAHQDDEPSVAVDAEESKSDEESE